MHLLNKIDNAGDITEVQFFRTITDTLSEPAPLHFSRFIIRELISNISVRKKNIEELLV